VTLDRQADQAASGPRWLTDPRIAQLLRNALRYGERERYFYTLRAWVIMSNHVHVLLEPKVPLPLITRWLKVRNDDELNRIVRYIEYNPVTAGLVQTPADWPWSSASNGRRKRLPYYLAVLADVGVHHRQQADHACQKDAVLQREAE
jgi:REP element-mobilizing transposase RayT